MAPKYVIETRYGREAMKQTFLMSNVWPQTPDLNRGPWERLETPISRGLYDMPSYVETYGAIWVITGPIFEGDVETVPSGDEIPDRFYKR